MSGGVDSSVAAALLLEEGYEVEGVTLRLSDGEDNSCCSEQDILDARAVCDRLSVRHTVLDRQKVFSSAVKDYFARTYAGGGTPNPCVECNRSVKFQAMLEYCLERDFDGIATGHYVRVAPSEDGSRTLLYRPADRHKDQTYVLYRLSQEQLSRCLFPLASYTKSEIREKALELGLSVAEKKDSQDVCFLKDGDYRDYLTSYFGRPFPSGDFVLSDGTPVGKHNGLPFYTVGQRKGLGIAYAHPLYVLGKDEKTNTVRLGREEDLYSSETTVRRLHFIPFDTIDAPLRVTCKIRYSQTEVPATVLPLGEDRARVLFDAPQRAVTAGQSAVFYDGDLLLGGGEIVPDLI